VPDEVRFLRLKALRLFPELQGRPGPLLTGTGVTGATASPLWQTLTGASDVSAGVTFCVDFAAEAGAPCAIVVTAGVAIVSLFWRRQDWLVIRIHRQRVFPRPSPSSLYRHLRRRRWWRRKRRRLFIWLRRSQPLLVISVDAGFPMRPALYRATRAFEYHSRHVASCLFSISGE